MTGSTMVATLLLASCCVAAMGYAIQRGGTCAVAAVDEWLHTRRAHRLAAMLEASLWVAGGLVLAQLLGLAGSMPAAEPVDRWTLLGAALLGLGAWLNGACAFGTIARLGSGDWAYALTPLGFYLGCLMAQASGLRPAATAADADPPVLQAAVVLAPLFVVYAGWRLWRALRGGVLRRLGERLWAPHAATIVIGVTFVVSWLAAGRWAYTDLLADLAQGMAGDARGRIGLLLALAGGALLGGWSAGRWRAVPPAPAACARCLAGGALMGWGSLAIPGSNDGLILIGLPLLQPHAWLALATMGATIALALTLQRAWAARRAGATA